MARTKLLASVAVVMVVSVVAFAATTNAPAPRGEAPQATGSITNLSGITDCVQNNSVTFTINITGTTDDGGGQDEVVVEIWDDGALKVSGTYSVAVGSTVDITDTLNWSGPIGEAALGVGVVLDDSPGGASLDSVDPFVLDGEEGCGDITPTPFEPVPVTGPAGLLALIGLLAAAGVFVLLRRR
jgi:hypothetical protein